MATTAPDIALPVTEWLNTDEWPIASLVPDALDDVYIYPPETVPGTGDTLVRVILLVDLALRIPGLDFLTIGLGKTGTTQIDVEIKTSPFSLTLHMPFVLRIDADILRPLKANSKEPDLEAKTLDISVSGVDLRIDGDGNVDVDLSNVASIPRCMLGSTGVLLQIGKLQWLTPATATKPPNTPAGFTGLYLDDVFVEIPGLPAGVNAIAMDDVFIGTGGFSGTVTQPNITLGWDGQNFIGPLAGELFGFKGGLSSVSLTFRQNALVGCSIKGDVFVPYLDKRVGLTLGLDGAGGVTASAGLPTSAPAETGVTAKQGYLLSADLGGFLKLDVNSLRFEDPVEGPALLQLTGQVDINVPGLDCPPLDLKGLRIDSDGGVAIEGGWIDLERGRLAPFNGFPLELTKIGFGSEDSGRRWVGLNGGLKLAEGLPLGASVEGLRLSWDPKAVNLAQSLRVTLAGVALELKVPGAFEFSGHVSFFDEATTKGFRGTVDLDLTALQLSIDASLVVGRTKPPANEFTFFYLYLGIDLPTGIPLFSTGAAIYGFQGLVATNLTPDRRGDEPWYYGWYLRAPRGATDVRKWRPEEDAFALGVGATLGTLPDNGFSMSAKAMLILVLPGPRLFLEGKGSFLKLRPDSKDAAAEGTFDALLVLDVPAKLFQANLAVTYEVPVLLSLRGGADVAFSWGPPVDKIWHVYLGERAMERRWKAQLLKLFQANAFLELYRPLAGGVKLDLGAWIGFKGDWRFGPVRAYLNAFMEGEASMNTRPPQFEGQLILSGEAGISAFGLSIDISAYAKVAAKAPTPWFVFVQIRLGLKIDLWLFKFSIEVNLPLSWGNESQPPPQPITPAIERAALEHMKVDETAELDGALIPPDGRPVVIFKRPMRDLGQVGSPASPTLAPDEVPPARFSYQLGHVVLVRTDSNEVVGAAGFATVSGSTLTLPGTPALPGATGGEVEILNDSPSKPPYPVLSAGSGKVSVSGSPPSGPVGYRLRGRRPQATVQISSAQAAAFATVDVTLIAAPNVPQDAFGGGELNVGNQTWLVLGHSGTIVTVRGTGLPPPGAATLTGPPGPLLEGRWLASERNPPPPTKLMLWARTPYATFRRSDPETIRSTDIHKDPAYACGPTAIEEPICLDLDDLPLGKLVSNFQTELVPGTAQGDVFVRAQALDPDDHFLAIGERANGLSSTGAVRFRFEPPVERLTAYCATREGGMARAFRLGQLIDQRAIPAARRFQVDFAAEIDELELQGTLLSLSHVCFLPGWTCVGFDAASFPQRSTGRQSYAGIQLETTGQMSVADGVLSVVPAPLLEQEVDELVEPRYEIDAQATAVGAYFEAARARAGASGVSGGDVRATRLRLDGIDAPLIMTVPGVGEMIVQPAAELADPRPADLPEPLVGLGGGVIEGSQLSAAGEAAAPGRTAGAPDLATGPLGGPELAAVSTIRDLLERRGLRLLPGEFEAIPITREPGRPVVRAVSVTVYLPQPVTRVRVRLVGGARVAAYAGTRQVAAAVGAAGQEVYLTTQSWLDRVVLLARNSVEIQRLCYDAGEFGWKRFEQWSWLTSVRHSLEAFYREDPVLRPGPYRLDVVTQVVNEGSGGGGAAWSTQSLNFTVGPPPGLGTGSGDPNRYPRGGPLNDLATYVDETLPAAGERPHYRGYDVAVAFNANYVTRMFLQAGAALTVAVVDSNDLDRRTGAPNFWDRVRDVKLSQEEKEWVKTLHGDGTQRCAAVDLGLVSRNEAVACAGPLLAPAELHAGELRVGAQRLFRFEFVTSRFANFVHQVATFDGKCRRVTTGGTGPTNLAALTAPLTQATQALAAAGAALLTAQQAVATGTPTAAQIDAYDQARAQYEAKGEALRAARERVFGSVQVAYGPTQIPGRAALPATLEVSELKGAFLLESPEPLHWERLTVTAERSANEPRSRQTITFSREDFGAPDIGSFTYGGLAWTTNAELRVVAGAVEPRALIPPTTSWQLTIATPDANSVAVVVRVAGGGSGTLTATGPGGTKATALEPQPGGDPQAVTAEITGSDVTSISLTGTGLALESISLVTPFRPRPPQGDLRLLAARLPQNANDKQHAVDVIAYRDVDLGRWSIRSVNAVAPSAPAAYHTFAPGLTLADARIARVYGGLASGSADAGVDTYFGGTAAAPEPKGAVFELVDPLGRVVHELAVLPSGSYTAVSGMIAVPNGDSTRVFLLSPTGLIDPGHWRLGLQFARDAGPGVPTLSVGGITTAERAAIAFTVE
jgi:hypothetical protein